MDCVPGWIPITLLLLFSLYLYVSCMYPKAIICDKTLAMILCQTLSYSKIETLTTLNNILKIRRPLQKSIPQQSCKESYLQHITKMMQYKQHTTPLKSTIPNFRKNINTCPGSYILLIKRYVL